MKLGCTLEVTVVFMLLTLTCAQTTFNTSENVNNDTTQISNEFPTTSDVLETWKNWEKSAKKHARDFIKWILPIIMEESSRGINITGSCFRDGMKLIVGIRQIKTWAFSFIDASGKSLDGMLWGTMYAMGDYDQCLAIEAKDDRRGRNGKVMFTGKYCSVDVKPPLPPKKRFYKLTETIEEFKNFSKGGTIINEAAKKAHVFYIMGMRFGICVPSSCQKSDIQQVANRVAEMTNFILEVRRCELKAEKEYGVGAITAMAMSSFLGLLVLIGSIIDIRYWYAGQKIKGIPIEMLVAFSFMSNFKRLVKTSVSNESLSCLSGIRVLTITWIIVGHTYMFLNYQLLNQLEYTLAYPKDFAFTAVANATIAVDSFFVMGGFLVCYVTLTVMGKMKKPFSILLYIIHRLIRILPLYMMVVVFVFLTPLFSSGPIWHETMDNFMVECNNYWWANLLFINNYLQPHQMCLEHTWYVACDMQMYIGALLVLLPLLRWPKIGLSVAAFGILASIITSGVITYVMDSPPTMLFIHPDPDQRLDIWLSSYVKPYPHIGPYCIGMLTGYFLAAQPKRQLTMRTRIVGWCFAIACNLAVLYGVYGWNSGRDPILIEAILYSSCHRAAWALGVSWVIYNCAIGRGGVVNYILSWKCWIVLARLTYAVYLVHPIIQAAIMGNFRTQIQSWHFLAVWLFFGHLVTAYGCAFIATMLVEAPFFALEKILFRKQMSPIRRVSVIIDDFEIGSGITKNELEYPSVQDNNGIENGHSISKKGNKNITFLDNLGNSSKEF